MPSRINMGPDGGPYIAINENSGNIELEDNTGTTVAIWDDANSQWDFQNNPISNVDSLTSNSVNTERVNSTFHAATHDGSIGRAKIQNALDASDAAVGRNQVVVGPGAPDDLSGYTDAGESDGWLIDGALQIPDNTVLRFESAYVFLDNQANDNLFRNAAADSGDTTRNSNIAVICRGSRFHGNPNNQTRDPKDGNTYWNHGFHFYKVDGLTLRGVDIGPTKTYAGCIEDCTDITVDDYHARQDGNHGNQDGLHFFGPIDGANIANIRGAAGDDAFILGCKESDQYKTPRGSGGDITDIHLDGHRMDTIGVGNTVKLYVNGSGLTMDDIVLEDVDATSNSSGITFGSAGEAGTFGNVTLRDWSVDVQDYPIQISNDVPLMVDNFSGESADDDGIDVAGSTDVSGVTMRNVELTGGGSGTAIGVASGTTLTDWTIDGLRADNYSRVFSMADRPGQATNCRMDNLHYSNINYPYGRAGSWRFGPSVGPDPNGTGTFTLAGGGGPASTTVQYLVQLDYPDYRDLDVTVYPNSGVSFNYDYSIDVDKGTGTNGRQVTITASWDTDPGAGNDITFAYEVRPR